MSDEKTLLREAANEITALRHRAALMSARLEMFDDMMLLINTKPAYPTQGFAPDLVNAIERHLTESEGK